MILEQQGKNYLSKSISSRCLGIHCYTLHDIQKYPSNILGIILFYVNLYIDNIYLYIIHLLSISAPSGVGSGTGPNIWACSWVSSSQTCSRKAQPARNRPQWSLLQLNVVLYKRIKTLKKKSLKQTVY